MAFGRININVIRNEVSKSPILEQRAVDIVQEKFNKAKAEMIKELSDDEITKEIIDGPLADNLSGTLRDVHQKEGPGNLCAFLGFEGDSGEEEILQLIALIEETTKLNIIPVKRQSGSLISYRFTGRVPTKEEIYAQTPVQWGATARGRSWVAIVENGTNSFTYYLYKRWSQGRSGTALQAKTKSGQLIAINAGTFKKTKYTTRIIKDFIASVGTSSY